MEKRLFKTVFNKEVNVYSWWEVSLSTKQINKKKPRLTLALYSRHMGGTWDNLVCNTEYEPPWGSLFTFSPVL